MINFILKRIFGTQNLRVLKRLRPRVARINDFEPAMKKRSDAELRALTPEFKNRLDNGATVDDILDEAFAAVREASVRSLGMRHFDVQLIGAMVLHQGSIAEMKTGEGKTLVATLPLYLNALEGKGCHLVTVNDYLAKRDSEWMGAIYKFLGMSVGVIVHGLTDRERQVEYRSDITYGTNNEFGFDYLRDNMKESIERYVQRDLHYAIVDEVDSILIDEARTPLIISGPAEESADLYLRVNQVIPRLKKDVEYTVDEKAHSAMLTEAGIEKMEKLLGIRNLYDPENLEWNHHVQQALRAHTLYKKDVNYVVEADEIIIVDEFTGRKMPGRRWSDGLHQAVEAKENVKVKEENQTLATITFQNYFRMYKKLGGMTGTADTEAEEFHKIYKLKVVVIPTNVLMIRKDHDDVIYKNEKSKFRAVIKEIEDCHQRGQPVLVGTISVEKSEVLSSMLKKRGIRHHVLNAKYHEQEAYIVAQAGRRGALTISTNMAGRGTDIVLGGNPEMQAKTEADPAQEPEKYEAALERYKKIQVEERPQVLTAGGLHILGTERHESRRIDNQLRGRSGRQGDPGSSRFFLSLEDDLLRIFGAERITGLMERLGMEEDVPIEHRLVNRAIENAQKRVEGHNFDIRKNLLDYDDVMNQQRKTIYALRRQVLEGRYVPTVGEEDKKRGKEPPPPATTSGQWTIKSLSEKLRPKVGEIVDQYFQGLLKPETPEGEAAPTPVPAANGEGELKDPEALTHELYRFFGAVVEFPRQTTRRNEVVDFACDKIAASLIQQRERILDLGDGLIAVLIGEHCPEKAHAEEWDLAALKTAVKEVFNFEPDLEVEEMTAQALATKIWSQVEKIVEARETDLGPIAFLYFARHFSLEEIDSQWIDHLKAMDALREGIGLRGYGQKDPKQEYKKEGFNMFAEMMANIQKNVAGKLFRFQLVQQDQGLPEFKHKKRRMMLSRASDGAAGEKQKTVRRDQPKVGRNDPCPCGSGKKYKKCHGGGTASAQA